MHPLLHLTDTIVWPTYGLFYLAAFLAGILVTASLGTRVGVRFGRGVDVMFMVTIAGEVGSRVTFALTEWRRFMEGAISAKQFFLAGRVVLGGVVVATIVAVYVFRRYQIPTLAFMDAAATGTALGMGIGRLACLMAGCCFGAPTTLPWGITFTDPLAHQISGTPLNVPLHPTQILQSLEGLLLFLGLRWLFLHRRFDGQVLGTFLSLEGIARFLVEFLRNDPRGAAFGLSTSQWIGLCTTLAGIALLIRAPRRLTVSRPPKDRKRPR